MGVYLGYVQAVANRLHVDCLTDVMISGMQHRKLLEPPNITDLTGFNDKSIDVVVKLVLRAVSAFFVFPRISPVVSIINASIGGVHLGVGVIQRFRTTQDRKTAPQEWDLIEANIRKGFAHLFTAAYDFGIGYLLKQQHIGLAAAGAFAIFPHFAKTYHELVFKKPEEKPPTTPQVSDAFAGTSVAEFVVNKAEQALNVVPPPVEAKKDECSYLAQGCYIYTAADKCTFELIPSPEPVKPEEVQWLPMRAYGTVRRLLAKAPTAAPPAQST